MEINLYPPTVTPPRRRLMNPPRPTPTQSRRVPSHTTGGDEADPTVHAQGFPCPPGRRYYLRKRGPHVVSRQHRHRGYQKMKPCYFGGVTSDV